MKLVLDRPRSNRSFRIRPRKTAITLASHSAIPGDPQPAQHSPKGLKSTVSPQKRHGFPPENPVHRDHEFTPSEDIHFPEWVSLNHWLGGRKAETRFSALPGAEILRFKIYYEYAVEAKISTWPPGQISTASHRATQTEIGGPP